MQTRLKRSGAALLAFALTACDPKPAPPPPPTSEPAPTPTPTPDQGSPAAARALVERYHRLVAGGDHAGAYRLWGRDGAASGMGLDAFAESFARYASYRATAGPAGRPEGACGSIYVSVPVTITGTLRNGEAFRLKGDMTLRRVNDVPGSSPEQQRWHIEASDLNPRPAS